MNFDSPSGGGKVRRKSTAEPTMTMHTRAATDEIYSIFNQPLKAETEDMEGSSDFDDDDSASVGESTVTGRLSAASSDFDDDTTFHRGADEEGFEDNTQAQSVVDGEWTAFTDTKPDSEPSMNSQALSSADSEITQDMHGDETDTPGPVRSRFIPQMPDDYNPPYGPYRDPAIMAQNRLPFMTPIVERTECSVPSMTGGRSNLYVAKTPSKPMLGIAGTPSRSPMGDLLLSSPEHDSITPEGDKFAHLPEDVTLSPTAMKVRSSPRMSLLSPARKQKPVIEDAQCNPTDKGIRGFILNSLSPPLASYSGYYTHPEEESQYAPGIQKYMKAVTKRPKSGDEASFATPILEFSKAERSYVIRRELGAGAYAPVYLAESVNNLETYPSSDSESENTDRYIGDSQSTDGRKGGKSSKDRYGFEAVKMELGPPNPWEFYMIRTAYDRLQNSHEFSRAADSIIRAHELHVFRKESFLVEDYRGQGTLLDLINIIRNEPTLVHNNGEGGLDECLAMFFTVELFRTVEALHANDVLHGDIKPDNCLVRFDDPTTRLPTPNTSSLLDFGNDDEPATDPYEVHYSPGGHYGWRDRGLSLIDFGRSIDMRAFQSSIQFIADWEPSSHECNEIREKRPWTHQIDLYGVAGTVHVMLFGKYIESVPVRCSEGAVGTGKSISAMRTYRIRETLKRYWEREIWGDVFDLLLNPGAERWASMEDPVQHRGEPGSPVLPVLKSMRSVREKMEMWLLNNAEKKGLSLQIWKLEAVFAEKRRKLERF